MKVIATAMAHSERRMVWAREEFSLPFDMSPIVGKQGDLGALKVAARELVYSVFV